MQSKRQKIDERLIAEVDAHILDADNAPQLQEGKLVIDDAFLASMDALRKRLQDGMTALTVLENKVGCAIAQTCLGIKPEVTVRLSSLAKPVNKAADANKDVVDALLELIQTKNPLAETPPAPDITTNVVVDQPAPPIPTNAVIDQAPTIQLVVDRAPSTPVTRPLTLFGETIGERIKDQNRIKTTNLSLSDAAIEQPVLTPEPPLMQHTAVNVVALQPPVFTVTAPPATLFQPATESETKKRRKKKRLTDRHKYGYNRK